MRGRFLTAIAVAGLVGGVAAASELSVTAAEHTAAGAPVFVELRSPSASPGPEAGGRSETYPAGDHEVPLPESAGGSGSEKAEQAAPAYEDWIAFYGDPGGEWGTYVMRLDGTDLKRVPGENDDHADWAPDGTLLAGSDRNVFTIYSPDGTYRRQLVGGPGQRFQWPAWSPDGTQIAATVCPDMKYCPGQIWLIDVATGAARYLTDGQAAAWHPDSRRITYVHIDEPTYCLDARRVAGVVLTQSSYCHGNIHVADTVTGETRAVGQYGHFPEFSPDGTRMTWERYNGQGKGLDIVIAPAHDPRAWKPITGDGNEVWPSWTPDGHIVFSKLSAGNFGSVIWIMSADGSAAKALQPITSSLSWNLLPKAARRVIPPAATE